MSFVFQTCGSNICGTGKIIKDLIGAPGSCVPTLASAAICEQNFGEGCICSTGNNAANCSFVSVIIDIYIRNNTNETLHLLKGDSIRLFDPETGDDVRDSTSGWISASFQPPQTIDSGDTILIRGFGTCYKRCCDRNATLEISLQYSIGVTDKNLGVLEIPVCKNKPSGSECDFTFRSLFPCDKPFSAVTVCPGSSIRIIPQSPTYRISTQDLRESQVLVEVEGGITPPPPKCTSNADCTGANETCVNGVCKATTMPNGGGGRDKDQQKIIILVVTAVSIFIIFGFLLFLVYLRRR